MDLKKLVKPEATEQPAAQEAVALEAPSSGRRRIKKHSTMGKTSCVLACISALLALLAVPAKHGEGSGVATIFLILLCTISGICLIGISTAFMGIATKRRKALLSIVGLFMNPAVLIALIVYLNWPTAGDLVPAAAGGNITEVESLLKMGIDIDRPGRIAPGDKTIMTPLQAAADAGHVSTVELLIKNGARLNIPDREARTALYLAVSKGHLKVALALLGHGADPNVGPEGLSPLTIAVMDTQPEIVESLLNHQANANPPDGLPLISAAETGNTRIADLLLAFGAEVNAQHPESKNSALHTAAENGNLNMTTLLLRKKAKPNLRNQYNETALELAINGGFEKVVDHLVNVGAEIDIFAAVGLDDIEKVKAELEREPGLLSTSRRGLTPLHVAAKAGHVEITKFLIEQKAAIDARTKALGGMTPLHLAVRKGHAAIVELLLTSGADPNLSMIENGTTAPPLYFAVIQERLDLTEMLLDNGADVNVQCNTPEVDAPPIYFAVAHAVKPGDDEIVRKLIDARANVNLRKNPNTPTALFPAIENFNVGVVELLIENNADVNASRGDLTPIMYAEQLRQTQPEEYGKIIQMLKIAGARQS